MSRAFDPEIGESRRRRRSGAARCEYLLLEEGRSSNPHIRKDGRNAIDRADELGMRGFEFGE